MTSTFQKKTAVSNLKGILKKANAKGYLRGVTIEDCFGTSAQPRARALTGLLYTSGSKRTSVDTAYKEAGGGSPTGLPGQ
jgi:hypothetical protein